MNSDNQNEMLPLVDADGNVTGSDTRGECHGGSRLLHPVVHLHVFDRDGRLYLQKRPMWKDIQPGRWDTAVGGHVGLGEAIEDALRREAAEELGLIGFEPRFIGRYVFESDRERELVNVFTTITDTPPAPSDELDGGRFWTLGEIRDAISRDGVLTPNFTNEFKQIIEPLTDD